MLENYETIQSVCLYTGIFFGILAALGGGWHLIEKKIQPRVNRKMLKILPFIWIISAVLVVLATEFWNIYDKNIQSIKEQQNKTTQEKNKNEIIYKIDSLNSIRYYWIEDVLSEIYNIKSDSSEENLFSNYVEIDKPIEKKSQIKSVKINKSENKTDIQKSVVKRNNEATSELDTTTCLEKVEVGTEVASAIVKQTPILIIKLDFWTIKNNKVTKIVLKSSKTKVKLPYGEFQFNYLYHNQISIIYYSLERRDQIEFILKRNDVILADIKPNIFHSFDEYVGTEHSFVISQPINGTYIIDYYTINQIDSIENEFDFLE